MLKSNATSHVWPFGALAELVDNAQDQEAGSTNLFISGDETYFEGGGHITVEDDGRGMTRGELHRMLSFGYSDKEHVAGNVGRFGIGFKSGSMRLGDDVVIFTREEHSASVALLSQTFLEDENLDDILIPMFTWEVEGSYEDGYSYTNLEPRDVSKWDEMMQFLLKYTIWDSEKELLKIFSELKSTTGTRIIIFNLKRPFEFDFSIQGDIRMQKPYLDEADRSSRHRHLNYQNDHGQQTTVEVVEDYSLRAYLAILYLKPKVAITLQNEPVDFIDPIARITKDAYTCKPYKPAQPNGGEKKMTMHVGYWDVDKNYGFHIYNNNRLIRIYQKFGAMLQVNCMMKNMVGVIEADFLTPTHNKQAFDESSNLYSRFKQQVVTQMNDYYFNIQDSVKAGKAGRSSKKKKHRNNANRAKKDTYDDSDDEMVDTISEGEDDERHGEGVATFMEKRQKRPAVTVAVTAAVPLPSNWNEGCRQIHDKLVRNKLSSMFLEPVNPALYGGALDDYFEKIKNPMDLGTVHSKLNSGSYEGNHELFAHDVRLVFQNAMLYNPQEYPVHKYAAKLYIRFEEEWKCLTSALEPSQAATDTAATAQCPASDETQEHASEVFHEMAPEKQPATEQVVQQATESPPRELPPHILQDISEKSPETAPQDLSMEGDAELEKLRYQLQQAEDDKKVLLRRVASTRLENGKLQETVSRLRDATRIDITPYRAQVVEAEPLPAGTAAESPTSVSNATPSVQFSHLELGASQGTEGAGQSKEVSADVRTRNRQRVPDHRFRRPKQQKYQQLKRTLASSLPSRAQRLRTEAELAAKKRIIKRKDAQLNRSVEEIRQLNEQLAALKHRLKSSLQQQLEMIDG
ncbi:hypothetical protein CYMTET_11442 [Cymbomonas tetramitiformis]|uniref:Bromo domain-containing protein n=1 Tax=Cymbomonas tetramitiformis TaxID=36881 RepID=A0AAE0GNP6_9CHLO|nr:hypothetical protein CYMTET_11442 [Cymbomonas tetramitiformis]